MSDDLTALLDAVRSDDPRHRQNAALVLGTLDVTPVIADLVALMVAEPDDFVRETLTWAIVSAGPAAVPSLVSRLFEPDSVRERILHALSKIGDPSTVPAILPDADNDDPVIAAKAWWALGRIGAPEGLPAMLRHLGETGPVRRDGLTRALLQYGPAAVPALVERLDEGDDAAREHAADVLVRLADPEQYNLVDRRAGHADAAANALHAATSPAVDVVLAALSHDDEQPGLAALAAEILAQRSGASPE